MLSRNWVADPVILFIDHSGIYGVLFRGDLASFFLAVILFIAKTLRQPVLAAGNEALEQTPQPTDGGDLFPASLAPFRLGSSGSESSLPGHLLNRELTGKGQIKLNVKLSTREDRDIPDNNPLYYLQQDLKGYADIAEKCRHGLPNGEDVFEFRETMQAGAQEDIAQTIMEQLRRRQGPNKALKEGVRAELRYLKETYHSFLEEMPNAKEDETQQENPPETVEEQFDKLPPEEKRIQAKTIERYAVLMFRAGVRLFRALWEESLPLAPDLDSEEEAGELPHPQPEDRPTLTLEHLREQARDLQVDLRRQIVNIDYVLAYTEGPEIPLQEVIGRLLLHTFPCFRVILTMLVNNANCGRDPTLFDRVNSLTSRLCEIDVRFSRDTILSIANDLRQLDADYAHLLETNGIEDESGNDMSDMDTDSDI